MRSTLVNKEEKAREIKYPCLMITKDNPIVVLFDTYARGHVVYSERQEQPVGYYSSDWAMHYFKLFEGTIQLTNE